MFGRTLAEGARLNQSGTWPYPVFIEDALAYLKQNGMPAVYCELNASVVCCDPFEWRR